MKHIVQEGINTKKNSNLEAFLKTENVIKTRKTEKSCPINLSGKCVDMVADCSIVLFSTFSVKFFQVSCDRRRKSACDGRFFHFTLKRI